MGRGPFSVTTPEEAASMSAVWQLHGRPTPRLSELVDTMQYVVRVEQRTAMCQSMCSEPLSSATARMFTVLLSGRSCSKNCLAADGDGVRQQGAVKNKRAQIRTICEIIKKVWFGVVRYGLGWVGLGWVGLAWLGLAWLGVRCRYLNHATLIYFMNIQDSFNILFFLTSENVSGVVPSFWGLALPSHCRGPTATGWPFLLGFGPSFSLSGSDSDGLALPSLGLALPPLGPSISGVGPSSGLLRSLALL